MMPARSTVAPGLGRKPQRSRPHNLVRWSTHAALCARAVASVIDQYQNTDTPVGQIARNHDIDERDVTRIRHAAGIPPRRTRVRELPPAMAALVETRALLRASGDDVGRNKQGEAERIAPDDAGGAMRHSASKTRVNALEAYCALRADAGPPLPSSDASAIDRIERLVAQELAAEEASRAQLGLLPRSSGDAERCARTLAILTRTLQALARLRGGATEHGSRHDNDIPADIDEFRHALARRIEAFLESREAHGDAGADAGPALVDDAR